MIGRGSMAPSSSRINEVVWQGRAQTSGSDAWILVGIIGLLMLFYIMFLPPQEREQLLSDQPLVGPGQSGLVSGNVLVRNPGRLDSMIQPGFDHAIPAFVVVERKNAQVLASFNPFTVTNSWLGGSPFKVSFQAESLDLIDAPLLVFEAPIRRGILQVRLNGKLVYSFEPQASDVPPIMLKKQDLQKENVLEFSVSGVGAKFWGRNRYDLSNARVLADVSDISRQRAQNVITISPQEKANLMSASISFVPECEQSRVGILEVQVNGRAVSAAIPICNSPFQTELSSDVLHEGINEVMFKTAQGLVSISRPKISTRVRQSRTFIEYFELNQSVFNEVVAGRRRVEIQMDFVDDGEPKRATLNVNGHLTFVDQRAPFYARPLNPWVLPGPRNYVEVRPETTLHVAELRVVVR